MKNKKEHKVFTGEMFLKEYEKNKDEIWKNIENAPDFKYFKEHIRLLGKK